jgi:hypothetical protein
MSSRSVLFCEKIDNAELAFSFGYKSTLGSSSVIWNFKVDCSVRGADCRYTIHSSLRLSAGAAARGRILLRETIGAAEPGHQSRTDYGS